VQRLDAFLRHATQDGVVPGAVICVGHRGTLIWHQAYGAAAVTPTAQVMRRDTLFDIASLTKVVATTSLVLRAHHEGVCALDDTLQRFYPTTMTSRLGAVTVRQLLAHTGGLAAWQPLYQTFLPVPPAPYDATTARKIRENIWYAIVHQPLAYPPGAHTIYSDLGFIILGQVLETCYQQSLETLFLQKIARPFGLGAMAYRPVGGYTPLPDEPEAYAATEACPWRRRVLRGEVHDENAWAMGGVAGHAGLFATAYDLWQFAQALLDIAAGARDDIPAALLRVSWQRHPVPHASTRALGWDTPTSGHSTAGAYFSPHSIGHLGFTGSSMWIDLERDVIVVLCTNRVHPTREASGIRTLRPIVHDLVMHALGVASS
jgi:CubicO group peptidase (beta-lactamase class C family)